MFSPDGAVGTQTETVSIETNDPDNRTVQLEISATIELVLSISPAGITFPVFNKTNGSPQPLYAQLIGNERASAGILSVESESEYIAIEVNRDGFEGDPAKQIRFSVRPGMDVGRFRKKVVFKTDCTRASTLSLFVMGEVVGNIQVIPRHLSLGIIGPHNAIKKTILLLSTDEASTFQVLGIHSTAAEIATELHTVSPGKEYHISVSLPQGLSGTALRGEIIITTDDSTQETIAVRVFGRAPPASLHNRPMKPKPPAQPEHGKNIL